jgi:hypothetical protein
MRTRKLNPNMVLLYIKGIVLLAMAFTVLIFGIDAISQTEKKVEDIQDPDEVQKLIQVLEGSENRKKSPQLIVETIQKLGSIRDARAIPILVKYLDYEREFKPKQNQDPNLKIDMVEITHWQDRPLIKRFPAIESLFQIGKSALPALVEVIKEGEMASVKSKNALETFQLIFRDDLSEGVKYLEDAMNASDTQTGMLRLSLALDETRAECIRIQNL